MWWLLVPCLALFLTYSPYKRSFSKVSYILILISYIPFNMTPLLSYFTIPQFKITSLSYHFTCNKNNFPIPLFHFYAPAYASALSLVVGFSGARGYVGTWVPLGTWVCSGTQVHSGTRAKLRGHARESPGISANVADGMKIYCRVPMGSKVKPELEGHVSYCKKI